MRLLALLISASSFIFFTFPAQACDTTIRQAGFVIDEATPYSQQGYAFKYHFERNTPEETAYCERMKAFVQKEYGSTNVTFDSWSLDSLSAKEQHEFNELPNKPKFPMTLLYYSHEPNPCMVWPKRLEEQDLRALINTETVAKLPRLLLDHYCVFLFCTGSDAEAAGKTRAKLKKVMGEGRRPMPGMDEDILMGEDAVTEDKAAGTPHDLNAPKVKFALLELSRERLAEQLPTAAYVAARQKIDDQASWVGILYGKGKMFDKLLIGENVSSSSIQNLLGVLEENCSCSVDPLQFTTDLLLPWSEELDKEAVKLILPDLNVLPWEEAPTDETGRILPSGQMSGTADKTTPAENSHGGDSAAQPTAGKTSAGAKPETPNVKSAPPGLSGLKIAAGAVSALLIIAGLFMIVLARRDR
jgi:hypothetical protein